MTQGVVFEVLHGEPQVITVGEQDAPDSRVVSVGEQGPAGPPGPAGGDGQSYLSVPVTQALSGHRIVSIRNGAAGYADHDVAADASRVLGVTVSAFMPGDMANIQTAGVIDAPGWHWSPGAPLYLGSDGHITQTPPDSGFCKIVGYPLTASRMQIAMQLAVFLT